MDILVPNRGGSVDTLAAVGDEAEVDIGGGLVATIGEDPGLAAERLALKFNVTSASLAR